jgi:chromosome partitioning protein
MKVLAFINQKGGVGKTSLAINLAEQLNGPRRKVLLVDLDSQKSAVYFAEGGNLGYPVFQLQPDTEIGALQSSIEDLSRERSADLVVMDCPPGLPRPAQIAALLADLVIVPVQPSGFDLKASQAAHELVMEAREARGDGLPGLVFAPNRIKGGTTMGRSISDALRGFKSPVAPPIHDRVVWAETTVSRKPLGTCQPGGPAHIELEALAAFTLSQLKRR